MANLMDVISEDIKSAMKNREKERLEALRYLKKLLIDNNVSPKPLPEIDVISSYSKKMAGSIDSFPAGHEQVTKIKNELEFIKVYLPAQLEASEVENKIREIIKGLATPNVGGIMKELSPFIKGKFDGKAANDLVQKCLAATK